MHVPRLVLSLFLGGLSACQWPDQGGDARSAAQCPSGDSALSISDGRSLCVALSTVAEAPFQEGFYTAQVVHRVRIIDGDGQPVDVTQDPLIRDVSQHPMMEMNSGHHHSTPHAHEPEESSDPARGVYDLTAYYVMPSGPMMGRWSYVVELMEQGASEPLKAVFHPEVQMLPTPDVFSTRVSNDGDQMQGMEGTPQVRPYVVWLHAIEPLADGGHRLTLFLSTEDVTSMVMNGMTMMNKTFPAVVSGVTQLHDDNSTAFTVDTVQLRVSADGGTSWLTLTADEEREGRYRVDVPGLVRGERATLIVALTVNGLSMATAAGNEGVLSLLVP